MRREMSTFAFTVAEGPLSARAAPVGQSEGRLSIQIDGAPLGSGLSHSAFLYLSVAQVEDLHALIEAYLMAREGVQTLAYGLAQADLYPTKEQASNGK